MALRTALTEMFGLRHPIILAPMGSVAGGRLAAAVTGAGGLGLVGGAYGDPAVLQRELAIARAEAKGPWGAGLITWHATAETVALCLSYRPQAFLLSFGDPRPYVPAIKAAGCRLICQVQDVDEALRAQAAGADLIVAQGTEAGGHGAARATLPLVPAVVDAVAPLPVVAAGGIADGRGLAAALLLGAAGAMIGTRFYATVESLGHERAKARLVAAKGSQTQRTRVFDIVRRHDWPEPWTGRALHNDFLARWHGREDELQAAMDREGPAFQAAQQAGDFDTVMVWAGEAVDLVHGVEPAGALLQRIGAEAEARLRAASGLLLP